ncbi:mucin-associated surface protein (MASP), putative, partial [Trypanosoma cruzi marinkellei]
FFKIMNKRNPCFIVFICFRCPAVCSLPLPASVTLHASQTHSYAWHAHKCLRGITFEDGCMRAGATLCSPLFCVCFNVFTLLLFVYLCFVFNCFACVFSVCLLRGVVCFCPFIRFNCLMVCVRCRCWAAAICDCAVAVRGVAAVSLLLLPLCVDGELVCAEGCTQVTGVMAMMMTGRVLLVCALCVLWCGAGGGDALFFGNDDEMNEYYYGVNSTYCKYFPGNFFKCNKTNATEPASATANSVTGRSGGEREGDSRGHLDGGGPAESQGQQLQESVAGKPGAVGHTQELPEQKSKDESPPKAESPEGPTNSKNTMSSGEPQDPITTTELQSAQSPLQSQPPAAGNPTATGDSSPEPETAASSDATGSTPAGAGAEPTSPSPAGHAAASVPGENSAAEGTPDNNTNTTDTATGEGNSTAAGMPAPLFSAPTKSALGSSVGNDACFHDTRLHAWLLLVLAALAYGTLG